MVLRSWNRSWNVISLSFARHLQLRGMVAVEVAEEEVQALDEGRCTLLFYSMLCLFRCFSTYKSILIYRTYDRSKLIV